MTVKEIVTQAAQLSARERWFVVTELLHSLQVETATKAANEPAADDEFSAARLRGILKPDGPIPTDREIKEDYVSYLIEKYQ
jgi:hypothetical protein